MNSLKAYGQAYTGANAVANVDANVEDNGQRYLLAKAHIFTKVFLTASIAYISTTFLPALSQGISVQPFRVETKEQVINQRQFGWERPLTEKDPNLSHWHWEPINNSFRKVQSKAIYGKPTRALALKAQIPQIAKSSDKESLSGKLWNNRNPEITANGRIFRLPIASPVVATYDSTFHTEPGWVSQRRAQTSLAGKILKKRTNDI